MQGSSHNVVEKDDRDLRTLILDRASRLLVEDGYSGISMRKIAQAIGYSATTIYHQFGSKDGLFHALVEEGMDRLARYLDQAKGDGLAALCRAYVNFGLENREYYEIMFLVTPDSVDRYPIHKYRRARRNLDLFAEAVADVLGAPSTDLQYVRSEATTVWAALHGIVALIVAGRIDRGIGEEQFVVGSIRRIVGAYSSGALA